jgi:hypothetical protein
LSYQRLAIVVFLLLVAAGAESFHTPVADSALPGRTLPAVERSVEVRSPRPGTQILEQDKGGGTESAWAPGVILVGLTSKMGAPLAVQTGTRLGNVSLDAALGQVGVREVEPLFRADDGQARDAARLATVTTISFDRHPRRPPAQHRDPAPRRAAGVGGAQTSGGISSRRAS